MPRSLAGRSAAPSFLRDSERRVRAETWYPLPGVDSWHRCRSREAFDRPSLGEDDAFRTNADSNPGRGASLPDEEAHESAATIRPSVNG